MNRRIEILLADFEIGGVADPVVMIVGVPNRKRVVETFADAER